MTEAPDWTDSLLQADPSPATLRVVVQHLKNENRWAKALGACLRGVRRFPHDPALRELLADIYQEKGFLGLAEEELLRLAREAGEFASVWKKLALLYIRQKRGQEACPLLERYLVLCPGDTECETLLQSLSSQQPPDPAAGEDEAEPPIVPLASPTLAELYLAQDRIQEAIKTYESVLRANPEDHASRDRLAQLKASLEAERPLPSSGTQTLAILERWLQKVQERARRDPST